MPRCSDDPDGDGCEIIEEPGPPRFMAADGFGTEVAPSAHGPRGKLQGRLAAVLAIATGAAALEIAGSWWSGSLALLSDGSHVATDAVAVGLSLAAVRLAERPHTPKMSFGYHRVEVLAAFVNALLLAGIASFLLVRAYDHAAHPQPVEGGAMFAVGVAGLGANLLMIALLRPEARRNINIRGAFLHAYGDTLGSVGVVVGAVLISVTGVVLIDVGIAVGIVGLMAISAGRLVRDSAQIILEGSPTGLRPEEIAETIRSVHGVRGVHDLHVWTVTSGLIVLTGHITVDGDATVQETSKLVDAVQARLRERFGIVHSTLQVDSIQEEMIPATEVSRPDGPQG